MTIVFEPLSPDWRNDPYSVFANLREHDPVHWAPEAKAFCVSRYDEKMLSVLSTERTSS